MTLEGKSDLNIIELFETKKLVKICAPMVRYSKLQFRNLVKKYNCDITFTPMVLADSFCKSEKARNNEFTTNLVDTPVITQFAANTVHDFVGAAYMVSPYCNGVDLNCGCPQSWAKQLGLGCSMLNKPELIFDIVRQCRNQIQKPFTVSVKMRISKNLKKTVDICKQLEKAGVSFLTVHSRTSDQLTGDINMEALQLISESIHVPVVANGGIKNLEDCHDLQEKSKCKGIMVANGLLTNPTLFTGNNITTEECIQNWVDICYNSTVCNINYESICSLQNHKPSIPEKPYNLTFQCFHHHLVFMLEKILTRKQKQTFNNLQKFCDVLDYIENSFNIIPRLYGEDQFYNYKLINTNYENRDTFYNKFKTDTMKENSEFIYSYETNNGNFFNSKLNIVQNEETNICDWSNIFLEND